MGSCLPEWLYRKIRKLKSAMQGTLLLPGAVAYTRTIRRLFNREMVVLRASNKGNSPEVLHVDCIPLRMSGQLVTTHKNTNLQKVSHVKFHSDIKRNPAEEKIADAKVEKFSNAITLILRAEAAAKAKKLVYVFINVRQLTPTAFAYAVDDTRDKISPGAQTSIKLKFEEIFNAPPAR